MGTPETALRWTCQSASWTSAMSNLLLVCQADFFEKVGRASPMSLLLISCQEEYFFQLISQQIRFSSEKETRRHQFEIITGAPARRSCATLFKFPRAHPENTVCPWLW